MGSLVPLPGAGAGSGAHRRPRIVVYPPEPDGPPGDEPVAVALAQAAPKAKRRPVSTAVAPPVDRAETLRAVMDEIGHRWGQSAIVRLGEVRRAVSAATRPRDARLAEAPPWWPVVAGDAVLRPRMLEVVAAESAGALSLSLTWLAAARPTLAAIVDPQHRFYPPSAAACGLDFTRLVVVRPPAATGRLAFDACVVLLKSEAFDAVVCVLPNGAADLRVSVRLASYLAALTARSGSSLVLVSPPDRRRPVGVLGPAADYRVTLGQRRWQWQEGQLAGPRVRVRTDRARSAEAMEGAEHELTLGLRQGYGAVVGGVGGAAFELRASVRLVRPAEYATGDERPALRVAEARG